MALIELALVVVYVCVLLIKVCDQSSIKVSLRAQYDEGTKTTCSTFGFGPSANGEVWPLCSVFVLTWYPKLLFD